MRTPKSHFAAEAEIDRESTRQASFRRPFRPIFRASGAPLLWKSQQMMSRHKQIGQRRQIEQAVAVLCHAAIARLGKAKDSLDDEEGMFDLGRARSTSSGSSPVPGPAAPCSGSPSGW